MSFKETIFNFNSETAAELQRQKANDLKKALDLGIETPKAIGASLEIQRGMGIISQSFYNSKKDRVLVSSEEGNVEFQFSPEQKVMLQKTVDWVKNFFDQESPENKTKGGGHGFDHNQRVAGMAYKIAIAEGVDPFLPVLASIIIDIGRTSNDPKSKGWQHGELSRKMSRDFLNSLNLTGQEKETVGNAIEDHSKKNENVRLKIKEERPVVNVNINTDNPEILATSRTEVGYRTSSEVEVVQIVMDADRLDALGALGPLRSAAFRPDVPLVRMEESETDSTDNKIGSMWQDMKFRQLEWVDMMWTKTGKKIAEERKKFHEIYLAQLKKDTDVMYEGYKAIGI